jgi:hypothetical protein
MVTMLLGVGVDINTRDQVSPLVWSVDGLSLSFPSVERLPSTVLVAVLVKVTMWKCFGLMEKTLFAITRPINKSLVSQVMWKE